MDAGLFRSRQVRPALVAGCLMGLVGIGSGCGAPRPASIPDRFVRGADDPVTLPLPPGTAAGAIPANPAAPPPNPASEKLTVEPTLEGSEPALAAALADVRRQESVEGLRRLGAEYHRLGVLDHADARLTRALALGPQDAASWEARARVRRDWGLPELALPDAHRAVYFAPQSASAHNTLGTVLFALGQSGDAMKSFATALERDPTAAWAQNNLCYVSLVSGDETQALARCAAALALDPKLTTARNNLGLVHAAAGRVEDAAREFMAVGPAAAGYYNLGLVLMARGEHARAVQAFEAAGRAQPSLDAAFTRASHARVLAARAAAGGK